MNKNTKVVTKLPTGISRLDEILEGGFISGNTYLIRGGPGTGKTTIGLQFLCKNENENENENEKTLFISLSESVENIKRDAKLKSLDIRKTFIS